jgi:hypothetical protein
VWATQIVLWTSARIDFATANCTKPLASVSVSLARKGRWACADVDGGVLLLVSQTQFKLTANLPYSTDTFLSATVGPREHAQRKNARTPLSAQVGCDGDGDGWAQNIFSSWFFSPSCSTAALKTTFSVMKSDCPCLTDWRTGAVMEVNPALCSKSNSSYWGCLMNGVKGEAAFTLPLKMLTPDAFARAEASWPHLGLVAVAGDGPATQGAQDRPRGASDVMAAVAVVVVGCGCSLMWRLRRAEGRQ